MDLVDENTIGICVIVGTTYTGEYEDVKAINDLLVEKKIDCPIHGMIHGFRGHRQRLTIEKWTQHLVALLHLL